MVLSGKFGAVFCLSALLLLWYQPVRAGHTEVSCRLEDFIDNAAVTHLAEAKDLSELNVIWTKLWYHDAVERMIYYTRLVDLSPSKQNEIALLETIPSSPIEFKYIYSIADTVGWRSSREIPLLQQRYFEKIALLTGRHPEYVKRFLTMNRFADGEAKNDTDDATAKLKGVNRGVYLNGLKLLDPETRRYVCGDCPEFPRDAQVP